MSDAITFDIDITSLREMYFGDFNIDSELINEERVKEISSTDDDVIKNKMVELISHLQELPTNLEMQITNSVYDVRDKLYRLARRNTAETLLPNIIENEEQFNVNIIPDISIIDLKSNSLISGIHVSPVSMKTIKNSKMVDYFALFSFAEENYILGVIDLKGGIYFFRNSLLSALSIIPIDKLKERIGKCIKFYETKYKRYAENNFNLLEEELATSILIKSMKKLSNKRSASLTKKQIADAIFESMSSMFTFHHPSSQDRLTHALLYNQNNIYKKSLLQILAKSKKSEQEMFSKGISIGIEFYLGMQNAGYRPDGNNKTRWHKPCSLVPSLVYKGGKLKSIKEEYRSKYKLNELYIDMHSLSKSASHIPIIAYGTHPNVNGSGQICIGEELRKEWHTLMTGSLFNSVTVCDFLLKIEDALKIPNLDSAYFGIDDNFLEDAKSAVTKETKKENKSEERGRRVLS